MAARSYRGLAAPIAAGCFALVLAWLLAPQAEPRILARFNDLGAALEPATPDARLSPLDASLGDATSQRALDHNQGLDVGPLFWVRFDFTQASADTIELELTQRNAFMPSGVLLWFEANEPLRRGVLQRLDALAPQVARRETSSDGSRIRFSWHVPGPIRRAAIGLPPGAQAGFEALRVGARGSAPALGAHLVGLALLLPVAIACVRSLTRGTTGLRAPALWGLAATVHVVSSVAMAGFGHNYDLDSWHVAARIAQDWEPLYENTSRFPYGPTFAYVFAGLAWLTDIFGLSGGEDFHKLCAYLLCAANLTMAALLSRRFAFACGIAYLGLPFLILLTGWHTQFGQAVILMAAVSWFWARPALESGGGRAPLTLAASGALMGLSIVSKHIFLPFPAYVVLCHGFGSLGRRIVYAGAAYGTLAVSLLPSLLSETTRPDFLRFVIFYDGMFFGESAFAALPAVLVEAVTGFQLLESEFYGTVLKLAAALIVAIPTVVAANRPLKDAVPLIYLVAFVAFLPAMANQYLMYPAAMVAVFWRKPAAWLYAVVASGALALSYGGGLLLDGAEPAPWLETLLGLRWHAAQLALFALLVDWAVRGAEYKRASATPGFVGELAAR